MCSLCPSIPMHVYIKCTSLSYVHLSVLSCVCVFVREVVPPSQSCVRAEHKAVCSKSIRPERVNTLPREPLTHDPAGLSTPLNMTIHPLHGTRARVCSLFGCSYVLMHGCLPPYFYALNAHICVRSILFCCVASVYAHARRSMCRCDWMINWLISALCTPRPRLHGHVWESKQRSILCTLVVHETDREMLAAEGGSGY